MNCIIIEDQPPAQRILKRYIDDIGSLQLIGTFSDTIQAMHTLKSQQIDLIFLDINLPKMSGIDFLKSNTNAPHVILTTAYPDYALESYEFNVVDYLLKPFSFQRFVKAVTKVPVTSLPGNIEPKNKEEAHPKEIFIKSGYDHIRITIDEIIFIKSDADYTEIIIPQRKYLSAEPLRYWLKVLDENQFIRIHKSYIINTNKIEKIGSNKVHLVDRTEIPIGRAFKESVIDRLIG